MSIKDLIKKYRVSHTHIYRLCKDICKPTDYEEPILTEAEQRIKDNLELYSQHTKFHQKDFTVLNSGILEPLITIRPRNYF